MKNTETDNGEESSRKEHKERHATMTNMMVDVHVFCISSIDF